MISEGAFGVAVRSDRWIYRLLGWRDTLCGNRRNHWVCSCFDALCASLRRYRSHCRTSDLGTWKIGHTCPARCKK